MSSKVSDKVAQKVTVILLLPCHKHVCYYI